MTFAKAGSLQSALNGKSQDDQQSTLEYWRVEKADSLIILPIQKANVDLSPSSQDRFLLPRSFYRPGLGITTLDFPGGRLLPEQQPETLIPQILQREFLLSKSPSYLLLMLSDRLSIVYSKRLLIDS
jgi:hypothetical protein